MIAGVYPETVLSQSWRYGFPACSLGFSYSEAERPAHFALTLLPPLPRPPSALQSSAEWPTRPRPAGQPDALPLLGGRAGQDVFSDFLAHLPTAELGLRVVGTAGSWCLTGEGEGGPSGDLLRNSPQEVLPRTWEDQGGQSRLCLACGRRPARLCSRTLSLVAPALVLPWLGRPLPVSFPAARAFCPVVPLRGAARRRFPAFEISQRRVPSGRPRLFPRPRLQPLCLGSEDLEQRPLGHLSCLPGLSLWCQKVGPAV